MIPLCNTDSVKVSESSDSIGQFILRRPVEGRRYLDNFMKVPIFELEARVRGCKLKMRGKRASL